MDPLTLATGLVAVLAPLVSHLTGIGDTAASSAAESAGKALGEAAVERATGLWDRLWPRLRGRPAAREAVGAVATGADTDETRDRLAHEIAPLLAADPESARQTADLLGLVADRGIDVGSVTVTGDRNTVQIGERNIAIGEARDVHIGDRDEP